MIRKAPTPRFETRVEAAEMHSFGNSIMVDFPDAVSNHGPDTPVRVYGRICKLAGNSDVGVSHDVWVYGVKDQGRGFGRTAHRERLRVAREVLGLEALVCTVRPDNKAQIHILDTEGWECMGMVADVLLYKRELTK